MCLAAAKRTQWGETGVRARGRGRLCRGLWVAERTCALSPREMGSLSCGQRVGPDSVILGALWWPLWGEQTDEAHAKDGIPVEAGSLEMGGEMDAIVQWLTAGSV
jgi:hypothetical protein